jgi:hypothetical protein
VGIELAKGFNGVEEDLGVGVKVLLEDGFAGLIEDVGEHTSCMQINAAIVLMLLVVEPHIVWLLIHRDRVCLLLFNVTATYGHEVHDV